MNDYTISLLNRLEKEIRISNVFATQVTFKRIDIGMEIIIWMQNINENIKILVLNSNKTFLVTHLVSVPEDNYYNSSEMVYTVNRILKECDKYLAETQAKYIRPNINAVFNTPKYVEVTIGTRITSNLDFDTGVLLESCVHIYALLLMFYGQVKSKLKNNKSEGACYVATAVYGSYDCPQVWTLRRYRDYTLAETWYGRAFIKTYYAISPRIVKWFGNTEWFKKMWQGKLDRMVAKLQTNGVESTPYEDKEW